MEHKLKKALKKTAIWMLVVGLVFCIFNLFFWGILIMFINDFSNDLGRVFPGVICLIFSTYAGYIAIKSALAIRKYMQHQEQANLQLAFKYESTFWNCLLGMVLGGISAFLLIILLGA